MPCYCPLTAWRAIGGFNHKTGKHKLTFDSREGIPGTEMKVPCGQCFGCRLDRSRIWAMRCMHEASLYDENCFITLTYSPENLPVGGSVVVEDYQKFMKRLRKAIAPRKVRFFHCGEYGSKGKRPHYHAILFGFRFPDARLWCKSRAGALLYRSELLEHLWPYGFSTVGDVTFESCAYVARYCLKKVTGSRSKDAKVRAFAEKHYKGRRPEYITMSRRPGVGKAWIERYYRDVYPLDQVVLSEQVRCRPGRFYDEFYHFIDPKSFEDVKRRRVQRAIEAERKGELSERRLKTKELCAQLRCRNLNRNFEENEFLKSNFKGYVYYE